MQTLALITIAFLLQGVFTKSRPTRTDHQKPVTTNCSITTDSLTGTTIYTTVDQVAVNEGGKAALFRKLEQIDLDTTVASADNKIIVAFIVTHKGQVTGERIIKTPTPLAGKQIIEIIQSFRWVPATCNGKKVASLVTLPVQVCFAEL